MILIHLRQIVLSARVVLLDLVQESLKREILTNVLYLLNWNDSGSAVD